MARPRSNICHKILLGPEAKYGHKILHGQEAIYGHKILLIQFKIWPQNYITHTKLQNLATNLLLNHLNSECFFQIPEQFDQCVAGRIFGLRTVQPFRQLFVHFFGIFRHIFHPIATSYVDSVPISGVRRLLKFDANSDRI